MRGSRFERNETIRDGNGEVSVMLSSARHAVILIGIFECEDKRDKRVDGAKCGPSREYINHITELGCAPKFLFNAGKPGDNVNQEIRVQLLCENKGLHTLTTT